MLAEVTAAHSTGRDRPSRFSGDNYSPQARVPGKGAPAARKKYRNPHHLQKKQQEEERNQKTKQQYVAKKRASSSSSNLPFVPQKQLPNAKEEEVLVLPQSLLKSPAADEIWQANASYNRETAYSLGMITRLRRAMAPPPTKEQLGEVIHAMVQEIVRDARRRGIGLKLTRQAPCVYLFELRGAASKRGRATLHVLCIFQLTVDVFL
ncbi:hypothetical protein C3747_842g2 [Trypanosoma cruzi]|uniref:Uncharacterized protein n=1 Tax=Trypanosoma cruzi TaxID=5693 RepID=A0A2V2UKI1_TRYCR|nr:hypothetical protein C3747_842g2 [Trypanosoma cruzi]